MKSLFYLVKVIVKIPSKEESGMDSGCDLDFLLQNALDNGKAVLIGEANYKPATEKEFLNAYRI